MATNDNTSDSARPPVPTFPPPKPGDHRLVTWPEYLELMGQTIAVLANSPQGSHDSASTQGTRGAMTPGRFVGTYLIGLSKQARLWGCTSPDDHIDKAAAASDREAAYVAALEQAVEHIGGTWELGPPDAADLGSWGGHPDEHMLQAHIALDPQDETWRN